MVISRTPYRVSFFGGGTDYPAWYREHKGAVLSTTINKYCYITCRYLPPFFEHSSRIVYSKIELAKNLDEIQHPAVRETLKFLNIDKGIELHYDGDLPARSGMGSSSTFVVGLLHSLYALKGVSPSKIQLASEAILVERELLNESVGSQDQVAASFGGFNRIDFKEDDAITVSPVYLSPSKLKELQTYFLLFFTGVSRNATDIAAAQIKAFPDRTKELTSLYGTVDESISLLKNGDVISFGKLLHESWLLKKGLASQVSTPLIDNIYEKARGAGALGGKILGAGGGGFILIFAEPIFHGKIEEVLLPLIRVPFQFENRGSQIIFHEHHYTIG